MMPSTTTTFLFLALSLTACSIESTSPPGEPPTSPGGASRETQQEAPPAGGSTTTTPPTTGGPSRAALAGRYSGRYVGDGTGAVTMVLAADGTLDVTATVDGAPKTGRGEVADDGSVTLGVGGNAEGYVTFTGTFANGKASGTWKSSFSTSGTWSVAK